MFVSPKMVSMRIDILKLSQYIGDKGNAQEMYTHDTKRGLSMSISHEEARLLEEEINTQTRKQVSHILALTSYFAKFPFTIEGSGLIVYTF